MLVLIIVIVIVGLISVSVWLIFNGLVKKRNRTQEAWSEIDVELKRRHDLIPNLVSTVQGYAAHEKGTFESVTQARANAVSAGASADPASIGPAENVLTGALRSLFAVAENYPQLRAVESFLQLQETLTSTEDKIECAAVTSTQVPGTTTSRSRPFHGTWSPARSPSRRWRFLSPRMRSAPCLR
jgi:LemA protein